MHTRARAGLCGRGTDLRGMEEGLALAGSVVTLNLYPCNIDFYFRLGYLFALGLGLLVSIFFLSLILCLACVARV